LRERAKLLSGRMEIKSAMGQGTTMAVRVPLRQAPFAAD
jgi:signal transduction histidine kinase